MAGRDQLPPEMLPWYEMVHGVLAKTGFPLGLDEAQLGAAFNAHTATVKASIPAHQLLTYQVKDGWAPLSKFLNVPVPQGDFPRSNDRAEFWETISANK